MFHHGEKAVGRIISVSLKDVELYHLRLILLSAKNSDGTYFENFKKFNGKPYSTYKEAAQVRDLINDSNEWYNCTHEASSYMPSKSLRSLLVTIICHCNPQIHCKFSKISKKILLKILFNKGTA